jgi:hypothetical protein
MNIRTRGVQASQTIGETPEKASGNLRKKQMSCLKKRILLLSQTESVVGVWDWKISKWVYRP